MPKYNKYYIVEFRYPIKISDVNSVQEAVSMASQICENEFDFTPKNWNSRIFEYSTEENEEGHIKEYFYNPTSSSYREITKNIMYFNELVEKGLNIENIGKQNDKS